MLECLQGDLAIDLIEVTSCQSCVGPSGLATNNITNNSAQITWNNDASISTWNTEFGPAGLLWKWKCFGSFNKFYRF